MEFSDRHSKKLDRIKDKFIAAHPNPLTKRELQKKLLDYSSNQNLGEQSQLVLKKRTFEAFRPLPLRWSKIGAISKRIYSLETEPNPFLLGNAFYPDSYYSFATAMAIHELTNQTITDYWICKERSSPLTVSNQRELTNSLIKETFLKDPPEAQNYATYQRNRYYLLERPNYSKIDVEPRELRQGKKSVSIQITGINRTLIEAAIHPERSLGIHSVATAFEEASQTLIPEKMAKIYEALSLGYPYWQRIAFYLDTFVSRDSAKAFAVHFGQPQLDFYIDRPWSSSWSYDPDWKLYYPTEIIL